MTKGERVRKIRKDQGMSAAKFGESIGLRQNTISQIETGSSNLTEQTAKAICREYHVNYAWLTEGIGEVYSNLPGTLLELIAEEYHLTEMEKRLVENFVTLTADERKIVMEFLRSLSEK